MIAASPAATPRRLWVAPLLVSLFVAFSAAVPASSSAAVGWGEPSTIAANFLPSSVSCTSATFCVAAGSEGSANDEGKLSTFNGSVWSTPAVVDDELVGSVSCVSPTFCVALIQPAAAPFEQTRFTVWNGTSWSSPANTGSFGVNEVSCATTTFCVGVNVLGDASTFNGTSWSAATDIPGMNSMNSVSCPTSSFCVAIDGAKATRFNGTSWSAPVTVVTDPGFISVLASVSCPSPTFCAAAEFSLPGRTYTFNGTSWGAATNIGDTPMNAVSCPSAAFCVAAESGGRVSSFNGASWSRLVGISEAQLQAVSCSSANSCVAVNQAGQAVLGTTDTAPPTVSIATPSEGQRFTQGQSVSATFSCTDGRGSGIQACNGPTSVDTSGVGARQLTVTATDTAGLQASKTVSYVVDPAPANDGGSGGGGGGGSTGGGASQAPPTPATSTVPTATPTTTPRGLTASDVKTATKASAKKGVNVDVVNPVGGARITAALTAGKTSLGRATLGGARAGAVTIKVPLTGKAKKTIRKRKKLKATLTITLTPPGGTATRVTKTLTLTK